MMFQSDCAGCGRVGPALCRACRFALIAPPHAFADGDVISAVPFAGRARDVLLGFKYRNRRQVSHHLAGLLVNRLLAGDVDSASLDVVTWAPTSNRRRHRRGFDQAEVVARRVAQQLNVPCRRMLQRERGSGPQTGLDRLERLHGPSFRANPRSSGLRVLVIDDVATTGSTLRSAAHALRAAGAAEVVRAAIATTPASIHPSEAGRFQPRRRAAMPTTVAASTAAPIAA